MEPDDETLAPPSSAQHSDVHDHGTAFQQSHGIQIYYASGGVRSPEDLASKAHLLALDSSRKIQDFESPVSFGVHPAATWNGNQYPKYVRRDIDDDLHSILRPGTFVLLVGDPTSGKSRSAFEAVSAKFPDYLAFRPEDGSEFEECVAFSRSQEKVIWLDELDRFLSPPFIPTASLDEALKSGAVLIGTMRADQLDVLSPRHERGLSQESRVLARAARAVTARAHILFVDRQWSADEVGRAKLSNDPRVIDASRYATEYGVAEYLAAGPQLYLEWQNAWSPGLHPRGAALVSAAVDLHRAGIQEPVSRQLLERLHSVYLEARGGVRLRPESILDAFHWALEPLHATSSLLVPVRDDMYRAFEYLAGALARGRKNRDLPDEVWTAAIDDFALEVVHSVGHRAEKARKYEFATRAYERLAAAGISDGSFHLGYIAAKQNKLEDAEFWYLRAIEQGSNVARNNLGLVLARNGREDEAATWFREAAQEGDAHAMRNLGHYLLDREEWDEARELFVSFMSKTPSVAKMLMGQLCIKQSEYQKAEEWLQDALGDGNNDAWFYLGVAQEKQDALDSASASYRRALEAGNEQSANNLAGILEKLGQLEEAESLYRSRLEKADDGHVVFNLAGLLARTGRHEEAETFYRRSIAAGSEYAKNNLALMLSDQGRKEEAEKLLREAASEGDTRAMANLAAICRRKGAPREALTWINRALALSKREYYVEMGMVQEALGEPNKAMLWYRRAMDDGNYRGAVSLGFLYERQGKSKAARKLYVEAAENGESHALFHLGQLYLYRRDYCVARKYLTKAEEAGEDVYHMLAFLALRDGDLVRARALLDKAQEKDSPQVLMIREMLTSAEEHAGAT
ncbi:hypothetical protein SUDANB51_04416 [Streptomyces sp. enrichment culture]